MGELKNLTEENVEELRAKLDKMAVDNPDLEYRFFQQAQLTQQIQPTNAEIMQKLEQVEDTLEAIRTIFDGHVLIDGRFRKITV